MPLSCAVAASDWLGPTVVLVIIGLCCGLACFCHRTALAHVLAWLNEKKEEEYQARTSSCASPLASLPLPRRPLLPTR
jgi:hypothetical protein